MSEREQFDAWWPNCIADSYAPKNIAWAAWQAARAAAPALDVDAIMSLVDDYGVTRYLIGQGGGDFMESAKLFRDIRAALEARAAAPATMHERYGDGSGPEHTISPVCGFCQHCRDCEGEGMTQPENCPNKARAAAPASTLGKAPHDVSEFYKEDDAAPAYDPSVVNAITAACELAREDERRKVLEEHAPLFASPLHSDAWRARAMELADEYAEQCRTDRATGQRTPYTLEARAALEAYLKGEK
jgi:hypothetical protein